MPNPSEAKDAPKLFNPPVHALFDGVRCPSGLGRLKPRGRGTRARERICSGVRSCPGCLQKGLGGVLTLRGSGVCPPPASGAVALWLCPRWEPEPIKTCELSRHSGTARGQGLGVVNCPAWRRWCFRRRSQSSRVIVAAEAIPRRRQRPAPRGREEHGRTRRRRGR